MKKFTKIMLIIAVSLLGAGLIFCGVSTAMGASVWRMAKNGELRYGNWHIGPVGLYYSSADGDDEEDDDMDETTVKLANDNFTEVAKIILEGVGGKGNVASIDNCITRLRLEIKDYTAVDEKKIKSAGVAGVIRPGKNSVQVVIGTKVQFVADEFKKLCK